MKGFSLLEVLIAVVIFSLVIMGVYGVFSVANRNYAVDAALVELAQQTRQTMFWLTKDIREASALSITNIDSASDAISFNAIGETGIQYYLDNNQLIREFPSGTRRVVANNIARFRIARGNNPLDNNMLVLDLLAEKTLISGETLSSPLRERVRLRNE
jgi:prepilin-type N-terminal cleavage/methylation domain-containing protein